MFDDVYKNARVLITGHTGFKGAWLSQWLLLLGAQVAGVSLNVPSSPSVFEALGLRKQLRHADGDVRHFETLLPLLQDVQPEAVFHLAAQPLVRTSYDEPRETFDTNVTGTLNLLEAVRHTPSVRAVVIVTTDKCYENRNWEFGYRETDRLGGNDPYSASKACAELVTHAYHQSFFSNDEGPRVASARAGNVIGGGDWATDRIVPDCIRAWSAGETALIRNPAHVRPWQHVLEPLSGYLLLGQKLYQSDRRVAGEAFNFGPAHESCQTVETLVDTMSGGWPDAKWARAESRMGPKAEATLLRLNCDKSMRRLRWHPVLSFDESIRFTLDWYRRFYAERGDTARMTEQQIRTYHELATARQHVWA